MYWQTRSAHFLWVATGVELALCLEACSSLVDNLAFLEHQPSCSALTGQRA